MKKTLITLAALAMASVAQAVTLEDADLRVPAPEQNEGANTTISTNQAYTMTLVIDWDTALSTVGNWSNKATIVEVGSVNNGWWSTQLRMFDDEKTGLQVGIRFNKDTDGDGTGEWLDLHEDNGNVTVTSSGITNTGKGNILFDKATYCVNGTLTLTWTFDGTDTYTLSALKNDGTLGTATLVAKEGTLWDSIGAEYGKVTFPAVTGFVEDAAAFKGVLGKDDIIAVSKAIPEPTTATLSLLALAGLAARRRRK